MASWQYQMVDNSELTTISDLTPHTIYTIRVQALTSVGPGPLSLPVQIKTQQGVPSQPEMLTAIDIGETKVTLQWSKPAHSAENIVSYELYWNDTYAQVAESAAAILRDRGVAPRRDVSGIFQRLCTPEAVINFRRNTIGRYQ